MQKLIERTALYVRSTLEGESSGHDWWHTERVTQMALRINREENANTLVVTLAALLHDVADYKLHAGDCEIGPATARAWLEAEGAEAQTTKAVCDIIKNISFKGAGTPSPMETLEGQIVQDADRLDALGAIGIARAFAFGGSHEREIYNPEKTPTFYKDFEAYKTASPTTINHFSEKLLLLKDLMNTKTGKSIANQRHDFMVSYLDRFYREMKGEI